MKKYLFVLLLASTQSYSGEWYSVDGGVVEIDLRVDEVEDFLWLYLKEKSSRTFDARENYIYQYQVIKPDLVKINAMCSMRPKEDLHKEFIYVEDGGACYFEVNYNLTTGKFEGLYVNGWA